MDPEAFVDGVRDRNETALSRLGSSKSLYAATGGEMEGEPVLRAAADAEAHAAETFEAWADDEDDDRAREVWTETAAEEREHHQAVLEALDGETGAGDDVSAMQTYLRGLDDTIERAGGYVGRALATRKSKQQTSGFFTGQADPGTASLFRDLGGDLDGQLERARDLLAELCEDDADWQRAADAADATVEAAYEEYTAQLEAMGVNPKPVC